MSLLDASSLIDREATLEDDRRTHPRIALRAPASVCLGGGPWHDAAVTRNLSAGGALIELPARLAGEYGSGDPIGFEVRIPASDGVWPGPATGSAEAVVVRSNSAAPDNNSAAPDNNTQDDSILVALRFVDRLRFRFDDDA